MNAAVSRWAVCGRSESKLNSVLGEISSEIPGETVKPFVPAVLVADVHDRDSLIAVFQRAALVLNCSGPYRFLGEPVVEACIAAGTDYMDITGEPQFMENMFLKYHERAQAARTVIVHGWSD